MVPKRSRHHKQFAPENYSYKQTQSTIYNLLNCIFFQSTQLLLLLLLYSYLFSNKIITILLQRSVTSGSNNQTSYLTHQKKPIGLLTDKTCNMQLKPKPKLPNLIISLTKKKITNNQNKIRARTCPQNPTILLTDNKKAQIFHKNEFMQYLINELLRLQKRIGERPRPGTRAPRQRLLLPPRRWIPQRRRPIKRQAPSSTSVLLLLLLVVLLEEERGQRRLLLDEGFLEPVLVGGSDLVPAIAGA